MNLEEEDWQYLPALWDAVGSLAPDALITQAEADDYVLGVLPPERLAVVESLLAKTPAYRARLLALRQECLDYAAADEVKPAARAGPVLMDELQRLNDLLREAGDAARDLLVRAFRVIVPEATFGFRSRTVDEIRVGNNRLTLQIKPDENKSRIRVIVETEDMLLADQQIALVWPGATTKAVTVLTRPVPDQEWAEGEISLSVEAAQAALTHGFEIKFSALPNS